jgi:hypothetical protein
VHVYVDRALVLTGTTVDVSAAAGPWKLIAHLEKTSSTDTFEVDVERATVRIMEQA